MDAEQSKNGPGRGKRRELPPAPALFPACRPPQPADDAAPVPTQAECTALWDKYGMPPHIREHSAQVALVASRLGALLEASGARVNRPLILAGSLLHDLGKTYTIRHGGSHAQLGAGWVVKETGNHQVAQIVYHHVYWPWEPDLENESMLPSLLTLYADKRVKHDCIVTLQERFDDLMERYGVNESARAYIMTSHEQGLAVEKALSARLGVAADEYSFDCRRLV